MINVRRRNACVTSLCLSTLRLHVVPQAVAASGAEEEKKKLKSRRINRAAPGCLNVMPLFCGRAKAPTAENP